MDKFPFPTIDRPFGIELWPIFDKLYEKVVGTPAHDFHFLPGHTPLSTIPEVAGAIIAYYATIYVGHTVMKNRSPMKLNALFMAHNLFLTIVSGGLLVLFIEQLFPILWRNGVFYSICSANCWTQKIVTLYYVSPTFPKWRSRMWLLIPVLVELFDKVRRIGGYRVFVSQEETVAVSSCLSPWCYCRSLLHSIDRSYLCCISHSFLPSDISRAMFQSHST
jgi:hypothetical protein